MMSYKLYLNIVLTVILIFGCRNYTREIEFEIRVLSRPCFYGDTDYLLISPIINNRYRIILYNITNKNILPVRIPLPETDDFYYAVAADYGKKIAFAWKNNKLHTKEICVIDPDGRNFRQLTQANHHSLDPFFSPDLTKVFFTRSLNQKKRTGYWLYYINSDGTNEKRLSDNEYYYIYNPTCTKYGKYIVF